MYIWPFEIPPSAERRDAIPPAAPRRPPALISAGLPRALVEFLKQRLPQRRIVVPGDADYETDREVFNPRFDPQPWVIVHCVTEQDVRICLEGARSHDAPFRVRSAGHSFAGYSALDDGMIIDVRGLNNLHIDPLRLEATVEAGCTLGDVKKALQGRGLHLPLGGDAVGIGGFVQGGGFGGTSRSFGMNSDNALELRIMLADGRVVVTNEGVNHDLWWAMRGGTGGNLGVLLEVKYRLRRVQKHDWEFGWPAGRASDRANVVRALSTLQDQVLQRAGPALNAGADLRYWPRTGGADPEDPWLLVWGSYVGSEADMILAVQALADVPGRQSLIQYSRKGRFPFLREARFVSQLNKGNWSSLVEDYLANSNRLSTLTIEAFDGAISSYPLEKSAFIHRSAAFNVYVTGFWRDADDQKHVEAYLHGWRALIAPHWNNGIYQNFPDPGCPDYRSNYWAGAFPALLAVKQKYDPDGVFRFPQMIGPVSAQPQPPTWPPLVVEWLRRPIEA